MRNGTMAAVMQGFVGQQSAENDIGQTAPDATARAVEDKSKKDKNSLFPTLKRRAAQDRADEIVEELQDMILNPGREDGSTGMQYGDWSKAARKSITKTVQEAEASAAFREFFAASRLGGLCMRLAFLLLASVASFAAFWFGVVFLWQTYGMIWGLASTLSALGLSLAFVTAGLMYGHDDKEQQREKARKKYDKPLRPPRRR